VIGREDFSVVEIATGPINLRTGPSIGSEKMSYDLFLPQGVKMLKNGRSGEELRVKIAENLSLWTESKNLKELEKSVPAPKNIIGSLHTENKNRSALVFFEILEKIPYRVSISEDLKKVTLTLYGAVSNIDRIHYDPAGDSRIRNIRWKQIEDGALEIECDLKSKVWGTDVRYDGGRMVVEIIFAPAFKEGLKGILVAVDPGHSPQGGDGAVSPKGIQEYEVNFQIAKRLKTRLEKAGAKVFLTKDAGEIVPLIERGKRAWERKADIFISIHANALSDGTDYSDRGGFSVYYFQPQSVGLGEAVHAAYRRKFHLQDEGLFYGNLAVCRVTQMPSILTESAYLMLPEEEEILTSPAFQSKVSDAITEGLSQFVRQWKERP
jgi:N-acetylmuramoyl-L-alanine amidase